jgi:hypothetical protein
MSGRLVFKIGEAFPASDPVAVFLVALSCALNDLLLTNRLLVGGGNDPDPHEISTAEQQFLFRMNISHVWELRESIRHARKRGEVEAFIDALPGTAEAALAAIDNVNTDDAQWISAAMEHIRNQANHYGGKWNWDDLEWAMGAVADVEGAIEMAGPRLVEARFAFADDILLQHLTRKFPEYLESADAKVSDEAIHARIRTLVVAIQQVTSAAITFTASAINAYVDMLPGDLVRIESGWTGVPQDE